MIQQIAPAIAVIGQALDSLAESPLFTLEEKRNIVQSNISCQEKGEVQWHQGEELFKYLKNVSVHQKNGGPPIEFNTDGSLKPVEIRIVNLQVDEEAMKNNAQNFKRWEEIGVWQAKDSKSNKIEDQDGNPMFQHGKYSKTTEVKERKKGTFFLGQTHSINFKKKGLSRELNPGPRAPEARIIPLDH